MQSGRDVGQARNGHTDTGWGYVSPGPLGKHECACPERLPGAQMGLQPGALYDFPGRPRPVGGGVSALLGTSRAGPDCPDLALQ